MHCIFSLLHNGSHLLHSAFVFIFSPPSVRFYSTSINTQALDVKVRYAGLESLLFEDLCKVGTTDRSVSSRVSASSGGGLSARASSERAQRDGEEKKRKTSSDEEMDEEKTDGDHGDSDEMSQIVGRLQTSVGGMTIDKKKPPPAPPQKELSEFEVHTNMIKAHM